MGSIDCIRADSSIGGKTKGRRNNKDVVRGSTKEGSRFWKKLRIFLGCMFWSSKGEASSNKIHQIHGRHVTNDVDRQQPISPTSSSNRRISSHARLSVPDQELFEASLLLRRFAFQDLMLATRTFKVENFHDEKGFGVLLKGWINPYGNYAARPGKGIPIAVTALNLNQCQDQKEWLDEISYLSELNHLNLVKIVGFCIEDGKRLLVHEYMCQGSLEKHLFSRTLRLTWPMRMKIAIGAANGLAFLHEEASRPVIFPDFKTSKILLDMDYNAKLWDFGLAPEIHAPTKVVATKGYEAPEYLMTGRITSESNVYSFGIVLLEMLTGRRALDETMPAEEQNLIEWLRPHLRNKANFHYLMDPRLEGQYPTKCAHRTMRIATHCLRLDPKARPLMSEVVHKLKYLHDEMVGELGPKTSHGVGPSNHGSANKYALGRCSSPLRCFQGSPQHQYYPLPLPPAPPNPSLASSSKS
ncbi:serine/threonine-protein kinase PBL34-like [Vigna umbellata]|uniref:serine/threonine-protein kinase PBL34-like n=1 Tax=Vigna umbellata TaxID=87088 RepID=UPI001F5F34E8|nr:serine/threonine-protein kinase PBL34-like [Vigna umbellata]